VCVCVRVSVRRFESGIGKNTNQNEEVRGGDGDADPAVTLVPDIKVARALNNKADLVILVQVPVVRGGVNGESDRHT